MSISSYNEDCVFDFVLNVISPKWNLNLVLELITQGDSLSFSEISARIPEISPRMLSMRLTDLAKNNIIESIPNVDKPKKIRYKLSQMGIDLTRVLKLLREWGLRYGNCENHECLENKCKHGIAINRLIKLETKFT